MQSWIVAIGDELLSGHTLDSNSSWLARQLCEGPFPCSRIVVVPDRIDKIAAELEAAVASGAARVFCCGGLGPTPDDRTMAAVARQLDVPLVEDPEVLRRMRERVARRFREGRSASPQPNLGTLKMALIPRGATVLRNPVGGAPPLAIAIAADEPKRWLFVLPGVPSELRAVFHDEIEPIYLSGGGGRHYQELYFPRTAESTLFPALSELERTHPRVSFGSYPQPGGGVIIRASAADPADLARGFAELRRRAPEGLPG